MDEYLNNNVEFSQDFRYEQMTSEQSISMDFKSLIVVPIRCRAHIEEGLNRDVVLGFLEVKSNHKNVFKWNELELMKAFADAIYPVLHSLEENREERNDQANV